VKVDARGEFPTVRGIASVGAAAGDAVAVIGYPLGTTLARGTKRPSMNLGSISKVEPDRIHIEAYAASGSSGAPVFDTRGNVIGVLFGSPAETGGRIIFLVPSTTLIAELQPNERALVR
jgi:S1-C subfamily serine protease